MKHLASPAGRDGSATGIQRPPSGRGTAVRLAGSLVGPVLLLVVISAHAAPICRWVDDSGRTQVSDIVPERYLQVAQCADSRQYEISPDRVQEAQERARRLKERADLSGGSSSVPAEQAPQAPAATPSRVPGQQAAAPARRPARGVDASTDCATWRRLYDESGACFGPYRVVGGGVKAEAFEKCRPIPSPDLQCGPAVTN